MHRSSLRTTASSLGGGGVTVLRPPKPPCWRDFVTQDPRRDHPASPFTTSDIRSLSTQLPTTGIGGSGGEGADSHPRIPYQSGGGGSRAGRAGKRVRARIHRTRSEHLIDVEDLPEGELTVSLADTRPHELRLRVRPAAEVDERLYVEENNRRCQSWLASIEAAEPLDDIGYTDDKDNEGLGLEAVDVEVPEETFSWKEDDGEGEQLKPPFNTSASSSDSEGFLQRVITAAGYDPSGDDSDDGEDGKDSRKKSSKIPSSRGDGGGGGGGGGGSSSGGGGERVKGRGGLRATTSQMNVHRRLSSKHTLDIPQHGLE